MRSIDLIHHQISLEYEIDLSGLLVPYPGSTEQALYIVYRYSQGYVPYFNHRLPPKVRQWLLKLGPKGAFVQPDEVIKLISEFYQPCNGGDDVFQSGYIANLPVLDEIPIFTWERDAWVVKVNSRVVSKAISVRQNADSAEVYVETHPDFRNRGYGRQTVTAWARDILNSGRVPFYSYHLSNRASASLAGRTGVIRFADVVVYEPAKS
jgi:GNAT superfamily N-acetyltransferase